MYACLIVPIVLFPAVPSAIHPHSSVMGSHLSRPLPPGSYNPQPAPMNPYGMPGAGMGPMAPGMPPGHHVPPRPRMMPSQMTQHPPAMYHPQPGQMMDMRPGMHGMMVGPGPHTVAHQPMYPRPMGMAPTGMPVGPGLPGLMPGPQADPYHTPPGGHVQATPIRPPNVPSPYPFQNSPGGPGSVPPPMTGPPSVPPLSQAPSPAPRPPQVRATCTL